jgi:hypothetical protein
MLLADTLDVSFVSRGVAKAGQMPTPGRGRRSEGLVRAERHVCDHAERSLVRAAQAL